MSKILIIENQYDDYLTIRRQLLSRHQVVPEDGDFIWVMDYIRVYLNRDYDPLRCKLAFDTIITYIEKHQVEFIIVDYRLSGTESGLTGVDFIEELRGIDSRSWNLCPYMFLTRTSKNLESVAEKLIHVGGKEPTWIDKGLGGMNINNEDYFKKNILNKIAEMVSQSEVNKFIDAIESIKKLLPLDFKHYKILDQIIEEVKQNEKVNETFREFLRLCNAMPGGKKTTEDALKYIKKI